MEEKYKFGGYTLYEKLTKKKLKDLTGPEIRLLNTCNVYSDKDKIDACVRGFFEGAVYSKEISEEALKKLKEEMWK